MQTQKSTSICWKEGRRRIEGGAPNSEVGMLQLSGLCIVCSSASRHDFYQTPTTVIASLFLKKIDRAKARIQFAEPSTVHLQLFTADNKSYQADMPLFGTLDAARSTFKIMSTKLELTIAKADRTSWPTLRSDEQRPSGIIQVGQAARA